MAGTQGGFSGGGAACADMGARGPRAGWYIRLLRDEVLAEWRWEGAPALHVHCHVSGQERWLAPPELRNYIFKREMALVRCLALPRVLDAQSRMCGFYIEWRVFRTRGESLVLLTRLGPYIRFYRLLSLSTRSRFWAS